MLIKMDEIIGRVTHTYSISNNIKGVSLIVLVITIIIMIILAATIILGLNESGTISNANSAKIKTDIAHLKEQVEIKLQEKSLNNDNIQEMYTLQELGLNDFKEYSKYFYIKNNKLTVTDDAPENIKKEAESLDISSTNVKVSDSNNIALKDTTDGKLIDYKIYGNTVQDSIPYPDAPIELKSVGDLVTDGPNAGKYKLDIKSVGKNLVNPSFVVHAVYGSLTKLKNGYRNTINQETKYQRIQIFIDVNTLVKDETYTFNARTNQDDGIRYAVFLANNNTLVNPQVRISATNKFKIDSSITSSQIALLFYVPKQLNIGEIFDIYDIQLEIGDKVTDYKAYQENISTVYLNNPLRKTPKGNSDYIDFKNKRVVRNINEVECDGNLIRATSIPDNGTTDTTTRFTITSYPSKYPATKKDTNTFSTHFTYNGNNNRVYIGQNSVFFFYIDNTFANINGGEDKDTKITKFNNWLKMQKNTNNPVKVIYELNEQIYENITLPDIATYKGATHIYVETKNSSNASKIEVKY